MENQKNNKGVIILLFVIILILLVLCILFATGTISFNSRIDDNNNGLSNENINEENNNEKFDENINEENNNEKIDESNFLRETRITLVDEPNCTGNSSPLIANIESNGNISISQSKGAEVIEVGNAKYLYRVGIISCDNVRLYYITEDRGLYVVDHPSAGKQNQKGTKVSSNKIIEFLGEEHREDGSYLKVLTENKTIEYIKYFTAPDYSSE